MRGCVFVSGGVRPAQPAVCKLETVVVLHAKGKTVNAFSREGENVECLFVCCSGAGR